MVSHVFQAVTFNYEIEQRMLCLSEYNTYEMRLNIQSGNDLEVVLINF